MSTVFLPSNGSMVLPPTNRSYGFPVPVQHAAYPATHTMMPGMMPGMAPMQGMRPVYGSAVGVPAVVPPYAYGGSYAGSSYVGAPSTVVMPATQYHAGLPVQMMPAPGYTYGASPYYGAPPRQPTTIIIPSPSSSRRHRRSSSSHSSRSHGRSRSRDYY